ncbi:MAG: hypothetical protein KDD40_04040, partial [Bdellovibrionales bacterium]|nr:hypothetical protein [Bdellovibrionales bacterium]
MTHEKLIEQVLHDLRTPLTALNFSIYSMQSHHTFENLDLHQQIQLAQVANCRLRQLVDDLSSSIKLNETHKNDDIHLQKEIADA